MTRRPASTNGRRWAANAATLVFVAGVGILSLKRPLTRFVRLKQSRIGMVVAGARDSVTAADHRSVPLVATDSAMLLLLISPACLECREHARTYRSLADWSRIQGIAMRVLSSGDTAATAQFGRLAGVADAMFIPSTEWRRRIAIDRVPAVLLLDRSGAIRARWIGEVPPHLAILNALGHLERIRGDSHG